MQNGHAKAVSTNSAEGSIGQHGTRNGACLGAVSPIEDVDARSNTDRNGSATSHRARNEENSPRGEPDQRSPQKKPLFIARIIVKRPYLVFGVTLGLHLTMIVITTVMYFSGYKILPINFDSIPINLESSSVNLHQEAWRHREDDPILYDRAEGGVNVTEREAKYDRLTMQFMYEKAGGNVFTTQCLRAIQAFEDDLYNDPVYQTEYCHLNGQHLCQKPFSILRLFDGTFSLLNPIFNDTNFEHIPEVLFSADRHPLIKKQIQFFLAKDSILNGTTSTTRSSITRSLFFFGYPLKGFNTLRDASRIQYNKVGDHIIETYADKWAELSKAGLSGMKFMYMNQIIYWHLINSQVKYDMLFIICSFSFIFLFMWFQTGSLWLSVWGMVNILFSFVSGNLVYNVIFDFKYIGILHVLSIFILLGIGADDVFIFCDAWKLTRRTEGDLAHRLSECYGRAAGTMFVTSVTTAAAFFINSASPILAMSSFGTFAGVTVVVNYLSIILFYPTAVIVWHLNWENKTCCCCCSRSDRKQAPVNNNNNNNNNSCNSRLQEAIIRFLSNRYFTFLMSRVVRVGVIIIFTGVVAAFIYFATTLVPDDQQPRVMKKTHNIEQFQDKNLKAFRPSGEDKVIKLYIVWGIKTQDKSMCHPRTFDESCTGKTVWNNSFDLNPPPAQLALLEFCRTLRQAPRELSSRLGIRRDIITRVSEVRCFMDRIDDFLQTETNNTAAQLSLPTTETKMRTFMQANHHLYNMSDVSETFYRYFETAYAYWISNKFSGHLTTEDEVYQKYLGESIDPRDSVDIIGRKGVKYGTRLRYAVVATNLTFGISGTNFQDGLTYYNNWGSFLTNQTKNMPPSVQQPFHATNFAWQWFHIQQALEHQGIVSVVAGVAVAWVILVLSSGNVIVGTMATLTIASVTVCVLGMIPLAGWKLGVLEALNMSLVVGLSVDYAVHLGVAYTYAPFSDRKRRVRHALGEIGLSVISGALTTLGSGLFMMFAQIVFFMQFGIFIFATIGFSIVFAMTVFLVCLSLVGPQGNTGATAPILRAVKYKLIGRKKTDVKCHRCQGRGFHVECRETSENDKGTTHF